MGSVHGRTITLGALLSACALCALACASTAAAQSAPPGLENVGVDEHLGRRIPLGLTFRDHNGRRVRLGDFVRGERPIVLNLVYHSCPSSCSLVLDGTVAALSQQPWTVGEEITVLTVSIDPRDTPEIAAQRRARVLRAYDRPGAASGWHFLVADEGMSEDELLAAYGANEPAQRLAEAVGFRYQWMPRERQYAHPGVIMLLTPDGRVARYLYGLEYPPTDLRIGLLEASEGRSVSTVEQVLLYCYRYDHSQQGYVLVAWRVMQVGGALTALAVIALLAFFWRRELRKRREQNEESNGSLRREASNAKLELRSGAMNGAEP